MFLGIEVGTGQVCECFGGMLLRMYGGGSFENWNGASSARMQVLYISGQRGIMSGFRRRTIHLRPWGAIAS